MLGVIKIGQRLVEKLRRPSYRHGYVAEHVRRGIAYQIRAMREERGLNQGHFSKLLDKPQSVVSRLEDPSYGKVTIQTLLEIAKAFDVALQVKFVPFSKFLVGSRDVSTEALRVDDFESELRRSAASITIRPREMALNIGAARQIDWMSGLITDAEGPRSDGKRPTEVALQ